VGFRVSLSLSLAAPFPPGADPALSPEPKPADHPSGKPFATCPVCKIGEMALAAVCVAVPRSRPPP